MGIAQDELKAHLMESNEEFRRLALQHSEHSKQLEELNSRSYSDSRRIRLRRCG